MPVIPIVANKWRPKQDNVFLPIRNPCEECSGNYKYFIIFFITIPITLNQCFLRWVKSNLKGAFLNWVKSNPKGAVRLWQGFGRSQNKFTNFHKYTVAILLVFCDNHDFRVFSFIGLFKREAISFDIEHGT